MLVMSVLGGFFLLFMLFVCFPPMTPLHYFIFILLVLILADMTASAIQFQNLQLSFTQNTGISHRK